jgi:LacI family transcriptional regulator
MAQQPTLSQVAALAKVDLSTASRVLRGEGRVSDATRQRILDAAAEIDFRPNAQAQSLATGISKTVGVLTLEAPGTFAMPVLAGVNRALGRLDVATLLYDTQSDPEQLRESVRKLHARRIDGVLVIGNGLMSPLHSISEGFDVPVVYAFGISDSPADAWFIPDGVMAGRIAGEHLIGLGRRRIAHITAGLDQAAAERTKGLLQAMNAAGLKLALGGPINDGDWSREWGVVAARRILEADEHVDGIFCGNDQIALGAYGVIRAAGLRIPDDIALVGYDNWERMAEAPDNLLTTIEPDLVGLGFAAAEYLNSVTAGTYQAGPHYLPCTLVLGETTQGSGHLTSTDIEGRA